MLVLAGHFSDQDSSWNKKHEEYRYTYEEFRGPVLGADLLEKGNYNRRLAPFLANGGRTATHLRECWERSVDEREKKTDTVIDWELY